MLNISLSQFKQKHQSKKNQIIFHSIKSDGINETENLIDNFLIEKNSLIIVDNVLWHGEVVDNNNQNNLTVNIRDFNSYVNKDQRTENLIIPLGDGMTVCRVL